MVTTKEKCIAITQQNISQSIQTKEIKTQKKQVNKQGTMDLQNYQKTTNKIAIVSHYLSIITLKVNTLNYPSK